MNPLNGTDKSGNGIQVVGLGEALFDRFNSHVVLGGAPLNMAFHSHQILSLFGGTATVVTRVGEDELGGRVVDSLKLMGMATDHVQRDSRKKTGDVVVSTLNGQNQYSITTDVAWDYIEFDENAARLAASCSAVCYGTLGQRNNVSRNAIRTFVSTARCALKVCDVNLRSDEFNEAVLKSSMESADIVKLNELELNVIGRALHLGKGTQTEMARQLIDIFQLDLIVLTRGELGTAIVTPMAVVEGDVPQCNFAANADSVGAGDASCAGIVSGILLHWPLKKTLELSNRMGAFVASRAGATPALPPELKDWIRNLPA